MKVRRKEYYSLKKCLKFYERAIEHGLLDHQKKKSFWIVKSPNEGQEKRVLFI